jgi:urea transporter
MIFWLMGVFVSYGIVAPRNWTSFWTMFVVAVAVAMAIHLTLDLDTPNRGMIEISSAPLRLALEQIGPLP